MERLSPGRSEYSLETRRNIAAAASRLGWSATVHRTDHAPQAALIALYAAIGGV